MSQTSSSLRRDRDGERREQDPEQLRRGRPLDPARRDGPGPQLGPHRARRQPRQTLPGKSAGLSPAPSVIQAV